VVRSVERVVRWAAWDGSTEESVLLRFENGGWTLEGRITGLDVQYAARFDAGWQPRQLLVFRDLEEPDLWLATDGRGRWGEVNGARRPDLDGCTDAAVAGTPSVHLAPLRRAGPDTTVFSVRVALVDTETLQVAPTTFRYVRGSENRWAVGVGRPAAGASLLVEDDASLLVEGDGPLVVVDDGSLVVVDDDALVVDQPGRFRRLA
jgi:uncharacterized protein